MTLNTNQLKIGARKLGVVLDEEQLEKFTIFADRLREENAKYNLVGDANSETILVHHFLDSLSALCGSEARQGDKVLDLGSGAGMPGLVLAIAAPEAEYVLLDSSRKKAKFLNSTSRLLWLGSVEVVCGRAEEAGREKRLREGFDLVVARAVAPLATLVEYALPFLKTGGRLVALRGPKAKTEVAEAEKAIRELKGGAPEILVIEVPYLDAERQLVIIEKTGVTPDRYPRRTGVPLKRPL